MQRAEASLVEPPVRRRPHEIAQLSVRRVLGLRSTHARRETGGGFDPAVRRYQPHLRQLAPFRQLRDAQFVIGSTGQPGKSRRTDTDDGEGHRVQSDRAADGRGIGAEPALPEAVRQHGFRRPRPLLDRSRECLSEKRPDTERPEVRRRHRFADDPLGPIAVGKAEAVGAHPDDVAEHAGVTQAIDEARRHGREQHERVRLRDGERPPQNRVERGEDRARGADPEGQRQHGRDHERGAAPKGPDRVAQVGDGVIEPPGLPCGAGVISREVDGSEFAVRLPVVR